MFCSLVIATFLTFLRRPSFAPDQRHEYARLPDGFRELVAVAADNGQALVAVRSDGNHEAPAIGELAFERLGHAGRARADENGVVRRADAVASAAVADQNGHVRISERGEPAARLFRQLGVAFYRDHLAGELREDGCLVAGTGANFQHTFDAAQ